MNGGCIDGIGLWSQVLTSRDFDGRPALFLDRDGVVVEETHHLRRVEDMVVIPGVGEAIATANARGVPVIVVTNQGGIGRGLYGWDAFERVQLAIHAALSTAGAHVDAVLACGYHHEGNGALRVVDHPWRKPHAGMIVHAAATLGVDLSRSWIVGDAMTDVEAGARAGLAGATLVRTGHGRHVQAVADPGWNYGGRRTFGFEVAADAPLAIAALFADGRLR